MNDVAELQLEPTTSTGTELSVVDRAKLALASSHAELVLVALAKKYTDLALISTRSDYQLVMGALGEFRRHRVSIERTGKAARDDATKFSKAVIAEERRLVGIIEPEETRLTVVRRAWEDEQERIRKEAEETRKGTLREKCLSFDRLVTLVTGRHSGEVQEVLDRLNATSITSTEFQDFTRQAEGALVAAKDHAAQLLAETLERERRVEEERVAAAAEAERRQQEVIELARQRKENEDAAAELRARQEKIMKEQQAEATRLEQERAEVERQRQEMADKIARFSDAVERQRQEAAAEERLREEQARQVVEAAAAAATIRPEPPAAEPRPTLADDLEGWRIRFKVSQKAHEALMAILASHQV